MQYLKVLVVGDVAVGKTCLMNTHYTCVYPKSLVPLPLHNDLGIVMVDGTAHIVSYWDTFRYDNRLLDYPDTDVFLLTFSVDRRRSFETARTRWLPEVQHFCPEASCLLVGCKSDLRHLQTEPSSSMVSYKEASDMAARMGLKYVETSALKHIGLQNCFITATRLAMTKRVAERKARRQRCSFSFGSKKRKGKELPPPVMPCAPEPPLVEVEQSQFAADWRQALRSGRFSDLTFLLQQHSNQRLSAHKAVVCSASSFFADLLLTEKIEQQEQRLQETSATCIDQDQQAGGEGQVKVTEGQVKVSEGQVKVAEEREKVVEAVYEEEEDEASPDAQTSTVVVLSPHISAAAFLPVLEFLYTGSPQFPAAVSEAEVEEVRKLAGLLHLPQLQALCGHIETVEYGRVLAGSCGRAVALECGHAVAGECGHAVAWSCGFVAWSCGRVARRCGHGVAGECGHGLAGECGHAVAGECGRAVALKHGLSQSITSLHSDHTGAAMKTLFFNQPRCADVVFTVQGCRVHAHRAVLSARSEVMAAMFSGYFCESKDLTTAKVNIPDTPLNTFLALLEYMYTDHAPIEEEEGEEGEGEGVDVVGLLMLAEMYCLPRLVSLCELYIAREVERRYQEHTVQQQRRDFDVDVVALLNTAQMHNADQLVQWCLHFMAIHFAAFKRSKEWANMTREHKTFVRVNRWPPLSALQYGEEEEHTGKKCVVM